MKSKNQGKEHEVLEMLEMFSTSKLVNDLMRCDGLTPDLMMKKTGMPSQHIVAILEGNLDMTSGIALLFEQCLGWSAKTHEYRLRVGNLRVLFTLEKDLISVYAVRDRKKAYE